MNNDFNRNWLHKKFNEIQTRILKAIDQLNDDQLNWRPDETSHSISTLIKHMDGNIKERIIKGILHEEITRNRAEEFKQTYLSKAVLKAIVEEKFQIIIETVQHMTDEEFEQTQKVRNRQRTHLDILHQCAAHYSEHMGQILYIAKHCLKDQYQSTSI